MPVVVTQPTANIVDTRVPLLYVFWVLSSLTENNGLGALLSSASVRARLDPYPLFARPLTPVLTLSRRRPAGEV